MGMRNGREPLKNEGDSPAASIARTILWTIPSDKCLGPQGMAIGPDHQILLGCNDPTLTVPSTVIIDDQPIGTLDFVAAHGVALPPGVHHITVQARGYFPWDREVQARPGSPPIRLTATLEPVPD